MKKTLIQFEQDETFLKYFFSAISSDPNVEYVGVSKSLQDIANWTKDGKRPDIYVLSLNVLGLDAQTIISRVRSVARDATIVGLLQVDNADVRAVAKQCGADQVFVKHQNFVELARSVVNVANNKPQFQPYQTAETIPAVASFQDDFARVFNPNHTQQQIEQQMYAQAPQQQMPPMGSQGFAPQAGFQQGFPQQGYPQQQGGFAQEFVAATQYASPRQQQAPMGPDSAVRSFVQKTIVVGGAKGGTGKTTISVELANALALVRPANSQNRLRVCLVDLDLDYGDVSTSIGLPKSPYTIYSWSEDIKERAKVTPLSELRYSFNEIKPWLSQVQETGLFVLPAPFTPIQGADITYDEIALILNQLKSMFDIVVIDVGNNTKDYTVAAYECCSDAMVVITPDLACIRDTHVMIQALREVDIDTSNFYAVGNKIHAGSGDVNASSIEKAVREKIGIRYIGHLPKLDIVEKARNSQQVLSASKNNEFTAQIRAIGNQVVPVFGKSAKSGAVKAGKQKKQAEPSSSSGGFLSRLFGRG